PGVGKDHRRFTIQLGGKVDPAAVHEVEVENKIRTAYRDLARNPRDHVTLADLRERTSGVDRAEFDATLKRLAGGQLSTVHLAPEEDRRRLTPRLREASVHFGGEDMHSVAFEDASPRPAPKPSGTATDVGIFGNPSTGKLSLYRESDTGKRSGRAIKSFDDMGALESWARDNGHTELADYAKAEQAKTGAPSAPAAKKAAPSNHSPSVASEASDLGDDIDRWHSEGGESNVRDHLSDVLREDPAKVRRVAGYYGMPNAKTAPEHELIDGLLAHFNAPKTGAPSAPAAKKASPKNALQDHRRVTIQQGGKVDPSAVHEVEVENKIRTAYRDLARNPRDHVTLADLRERTSGVDRAEFDATLKRLAGGQLSTVHLAPEEDRRRLTPRLREASVHFGGEDMHSVAFEDASPRPAPKP